MIEDGIIKNPASTDDVKQVLGVISNDVGYLCSNAHGKINPWSKHKPVIYKSLFCQDFDSSKGNYLPTWWKGDGLTCGFFLPVLPSTTKESFNDLFWSYNPPGGGITQPYRLSDFINYYPDAYPFIRHFYGESGITVNITDSTFSTVDINFFTVSDSFYNVSIEDFYFSSYYLTALVYRSGQSTPSFMFSSTQPLSNNANQIQMDKSLFSAGEYEIRLSITLEKATGGIITTTLLPYPWIKGDTINTNAIKMNVTASAPLRVYMSEASWSPSGTFATREELELTTGGKRIRTRGGLCMRFTAVSLTGSGVSMPVSNVKFIYNSFAGTIETIFLEWYNESGNKVTSLTASPQGTTYYTYNQNVLNIKNGIVAAVDDNKPIMVRGNFDISASGATVGLGEVLINAGYGTLEMIENT